jgi:hypothetical protein
VDDGEGRRVRNWERRKCEGRGKAAAGAACLVFAESRQRGLHGALELLLDYELGLPVA